MDVKRLLSMYGNTYLEANSFIRHKPNGNAEWNKRNIILNIAGYIPVIGIISGLARGILAVQDFRASLHNGSEEHDAFKMSILVVRGMYEIAGLGIINIFIDSMALMIDLYRVHQAQTAYFYNGPVGSFGYTHPY